MALRRALALGVWLLLTTPVFAQNPPATQTASLSSATSTILNVSGYASAAIQVSGTWSGTLTFEVSIDGSTYTAVNATPPNSTTAVTTATANGNWGASVAGQKYLRTRFSTYTSGTAVISMQTALAGGGTAGGGGGGGGGAVTVADGADVAEGATTDAVATGDANGTVIAHLRYLDKAFASMWDTANNGIKLGAGTQIIGALSANQSINIAQLNGASWTPSSDATTNTAAQTTGPQLFGNGSTAVPTVVGADGRSVAVWTDLSGRVRVTGDASMSKLLVTPDSVALPANQSVNVAQMNGVTTTMGNGIAGTGVQRVAIASDNTAFSVNATLAAETTKVIGTARILGNGGATMDAAPRAAVPTNGIYNLYTAVNAEQTAATNGQTQSPVTDLVGKTITIPYANPENFVSGVITSAMTGTTSTSLIASPGGSLRNYLTQCTFSNSHATVGTDILIQDGNGGTTIYIVPTAPAFGGATIVFPTPLRQPTTATAIYVANVTTGSNTKAACSGYKGL